MLTHCGAAIGNSEKLIIYLLTKKNLTLDTVTPTSLEQTQDEARDAFLAIAFLCGLNRKLYQDLHDELSNSFLNDRNDYPKDLTSAYNFALERRGNAQQRIGILD